MSHWAGQSDRHLRHQEEMQKKRDENRREMSLTVWYKRRRSFKRFMLRTILYQVGISAIVTGGYYHYEGNTESMILFTIGNALMALNWLFNNKEELR